jgi:hypothetical protein
MQRLEQQSALPWHVAVCGMTVVISAIRQHSGAWGRCADRLYEVVHGLRKSGMYSVTVQQTVRLRKPLCMQPLIILMQLTSRIFLVYKCLGDPPAKLLLPIESFVCGTRVERSVPGLLLSALD